MLGDNSHAGACATETTVRNVCLVDTGNRGTDVTTIKFGMVMKNEHIPNTYKFITYIYVTFTFLFPFYALIQSLMTTSSGRNTQLIGNNILLLSEIVLFDGDEVNKVKVKCTLEQAMEADRGQQ
jgi:hypothetical protein